MKPIEICGTDEVDCKAFAALVCVLSKRVDSEGNGSYKIAYSSHHCRARSQGAAHDLIGAALFDARGCSEKMGALDRHIV